MPVSGHIRTETKIKIVKYEYNFYFKQDLFAVKI